MQQILGSHQVQLILESCDQTSHTHFWLCPQKNFWSTFNLHEFVRTCTKSGYFIDLFWRYGWLKNPATWLVQNILAHISGTKIFQYGICGNTANNIIFHYKTNSVQINHKIFQKNAKKTCFWLIFNPFSQFLGQKKFLENLAITHNFIRISRIMPKFWKN